MLEEIIERANTFKEHIAILKARSELFPIIYKVKTIDHVFNKQMEVLWLSTLDEFVYNDIIFCRHFVESAVIYDEEEEKMLYRRLYYSIGINRLYGKPNSKDSIVRIVEK